MKENNSKIKDGVNITWKDKSGKENITFTECDTYEEGLRKFINVKDGVELSSIISIREYDRENSVYLSENMIEEVNP